MTMIPISLENQIVEGTLEHTIHYMVEKKIDTAAMIMNGKSRQPPQETDQEIRTEHP